MSSKLTWLTENLYKVEIRDREAKKEERLKGMQLGLALKDGQGRDCAPNLMSGVKAIFQFISLFA